MSDTHAWRKGNFKSVFRINCTKMLINFVILFYQIYITKQEPQSEMGCRSGLPRGGAEGYHDPRAHGVWGAHEGGH